jgi:uncharacterized membrane protein YkvA (DUF1232 family)
MLEKLKIKARQLKREISALYIAFRRQDVPWYAKVVLALVLGYALSPIDLIPDFVPVLGYLDDLVLIPLGITLAIRLVPPEIMQSCRRESEKRQNTLKFNPWLSGTIIALIWLAVIIWLIIKIKS